MSIGYESEEVKSKASPGTVRRLVCLFGKGERAAAVRPVPRKTLGFRGFRVFE